MSRHEEQLSSQAPVHKVSAPSVHHIQMLSLPFANLAISDNFDYILELLSIRISSDFDSSSK